MTWAVQIITRFCASLRAQVWCGADAAAAGRSWRPGGERRGAVRDIHRVGRHHVTAACSHHRHSDGAVGGPPLEPLPECPPGAAPHHALQVRPNPPTLPPVGDDSVPPFMLPLCTTQILRQVLHSQKGLWNVAALAAPSGGRPKRQSPCRNSLGSCCLTVQVQTCLPVTSVEHVMVPACCRTFISSLHVPWLVLPDSAVQTCLSPTSVEDVTLHAGCDERPLARAA